MRKVMRLPAGLALVCSGAERIQFLSIRIRVSANMMSVAGFFIASHHNATRNHPIAYRDGYDTIFVKLAWSWKPIRGVLPRPSVIGSWGQPRQPGSSFFLAIIYDCR